MFDRGARTRAQLRIPLCSGRLPTAFCRLSIESGRTCTPPPPPSTPSVCLPHAVTRNTNAPFAGLCPPSAMIGLAEVQPGMGRMLCSRGAAGAGAGYSGQVPRCLGWGAGCRFGFKSTSEALEVRFFFSGADEFALECVAAAFAAAAVCRCRLSPDAQGSRHATDYRPDQ